VSGPLDLRPVLPAVIVAATGLVVVLAQAFTPAGKRPPSAALSLFGLLSALAIVVIIALGLGRGSVTGGSVAADDFALFLEAVLLGTGILVVLLSPPYLSATGLDRGEYYGLVLFAMVGMLGLVSSRELVSLFVALEVMSVAVYALAGFRRGQVESQEAAAKYFITGAFSSALLLYGIALLYGATGSTSLGKIATELHSPLFARHGAAAVALAFLLAGFGFKVASAPFHMWAPDVYEGAPTTVTAFMAAGVKTAAFGALLRVFGGALPALQSKWEPAVAVLAVLTMLVGNLGALAQSNLKRMLAYSSVAHAGYLLVAVVAAPRVAAQAVLFYLVAYAAVNLGGFGSLAALASKGREPLSLSDVAGLAQRRPALAAGLSVFLISLTGVPVSAGFVGKFYLFSAAVSSGHTGLAVTGVLMSVVSAFYYLRVVVSMYMRDPVGEDTWAPLGVRPRVALVTAVVIVLGLGVYPGPVLALARLAAGSLP